MSYIIKRNKGIHIIVALLLFNNILSANTMAYENIPADTYDFCTVYDEDECVQISAAPDVTAEMCEHSYWLDKSVGAAKKLMMDRAEIAAFNLSALNADGSNMNDLVNMNENYNAKNLGDSLADISTSKKILYVNQQSVSANDYYQALKADIAASVYTDENRKVQYAIATKQTVLNAIPTNAYVGYSATDTDNEVVNSAISVNEPFIIKQRCISEGHTYYWGYSDNCTGWVDSDDIAICENKAEWLEAWQVDENKNDFIVVTQDKIVLEPSYYTPEISEVKLTIGTVLKEVPEELIPSTIDNRGKWNNYVVYLPVRDIEGKYQKKIALISQHYDVSEGYPELTKEKLLKIAFSCIGNRYGWGGMMDSMDCSLYTRNVYRCFGVFLPRNTNWQQTVPNTKISFSDMSDDEKEMKIKELPAGTLLYFPGHTMIYIGSINDKIYVLSALGSVSEGTGEVNVQKIFSVALNALDVRRANGTTWLHNLQAAVCPFGIKEWKADDDKTISDRNNVENNVENNNIENNNIVNNNIVNKVTPLNGEVYAAADDTIALDAFYNKTNKLYVDFTRIDSSKVNGGQLKATVISGAKIFTKAAVANVQCDKSVGKVSINKNTSIAAVRLKASGDVNYTMKDGNSYVVHFTVEKPKANSKLKKIETGEGIKQLSVSELFGTSINAGRLEIASDKNELAEIENNMLKINTDKQGNVKVKYLFLNKKYQIKIKIK